MRVSPNIASLRLYIVRRGWRRSEPVDAARDIGEQVTSDGDLSHLERDVVTVAHDLRADLDELLAQRRQRPLLHCIG
jgi:hypothetical protein